MSSSTVSITVRGILSSLGEGCAWLDLTSDVLVEHLGGNDPILDQISRCCPCKWERTKPTGQLVEDMLEKGIKSQGRRHSPLNGKKTASHKECSYKTRRDRRQLCLHDAALLQRIDPALTTLLEINKAHVATLFICAALRHLGPKAIANMAVYWRGLLKHIGRDPFDFIPRSNETLLRRLGITDRYVPGARDRSFTGNGVNRDEMLERIRAIDPRVADHCEVEEYFGLRPKEAALVQLPLDYKPPDRSLFIRRGAKGGRTRIVRLPVSAERHAAVMRITATTNCITHCLVPADKSWAQWQSHLYSVASRAGLNKQSCGVSLYAFRHQCLQDLFASEAGQPPPVKGGPPAPPEVELRARQKVMHAAGHGRLSSTVSYCGPMPRDVYAPRSGAVRPDRLTGSHLRGPWHRRRKHWRHRARY